MMPHEVQALMAKILFLLCATTILCMGKAQASESNIILSSDQIKTIKSL